MNKLLLGRYINGNSLIHRMDPRSKLALSFYFIGIIFQIYATDKSSPDFS